MAIQYVNIDKLEEDLTAIADAIRAKTKSTDKLTFSEGFNNELDKLYSANDFADLSKPVGELYSEATTIGNYYYCYGRIGITSLNFPNATKINPYTFMRCSGIQTIIAPKCITISNMALNHCTGLSYLVLPSSYSLETNAVSSCTNLQGVDLGGQRPDTSTAGINGYVFSLCSKMKTLILRSSLLLKLVHTNAFENSPFASGKAGGTLYVPQALMEEYQNATNWSTILAYTKNGTLQNQILPIEGSIYETHYVDGSEIL